MTYQPPGYFEPSRYDNAISYGRFSSPEQAKGQSYDRQREALLAVINRFGWKLRDEYFDAGISGGRGRHRATGALGRLLKRVRRREIPPQTVLIVETFDRLDREALTIAQEQFLSLINAGLAVYTTMDDGAYDQQSIAGNPGLLFTSIGLMLGAHGLYKVMSSRSISGWEKRRGTVTRICPGWLQPNADRTAYEQVEGSQAILNRIFDEASYLGFDNIAARFNSEGLRPWPSYSHPNPTHWTDFHIRRIVTERLVRGELVVGKTEYQRRRQTDEDGEVIEYDVSVSKKTNRVIKAAYPAVISEQVWQATNAAVQERATGRGRNGVAFTNLFQGLAKCALCDKSMRLHSTNVKGKAYQYYRCSLGTLKGCQNKHVYNYADIEHSVLTWCGEGVFSFKQPARDERVGAVKRQIAEHKAELINIRRQREWTQNLIREVARTRKDARDVRSSDVEMQQQLIQYDDERDILIAEIAKLEKTLAGIEATPGALGQLAAMRTLMSTMRETDSLALRARINTGFKAILSKITFDEAGGIKLHRLSSDEYWTLDPWDKERYGAAYMMSFLQSPKLVKRKRKPKPSSDDTVTLLDGGVAHNIAVPAGKKKKERRKTAPG